MIDESEQKTAFDSILIAGTTHYDIDQLKSQIALLTESLEPKMLLQEIVPEYTPMD